MLEPLYLNVSYKCFHFGKILWGSRKIFVSYIFRRLPTLKVKLHTLVVLDSLTNLIIFFLSKILISKNYYSQIGYYLRTFVTSTTNSTQDISDERLIRVNKIDPRGSIGTIDEKFSIHIIKQRETRQKDIYSY